MRLASGTGWPLGFFSKTACLPIRRHNNTRNLSGESRFASLFYLPRRGADRSVVFFMDSRPIGVFDSGLGGLTAVRQLLLQLPHEDIVYFGDTGRVPYGSRSPQIIQRYARQDCAFLRKHGVKLIIAACGTVSSVALPVLEEQPLPAFGVVEPAAAAAVRATRNGKIGVLGTATTIQSGAFLRCIAALDPSLRVVPVACPLFIPLVENGWVDREDPVTRLTAARYLAPLKEAGVDTLILGCTHFPLLADILSDYMGEAVTLIDSGREAAAECARRLKQEHLLSPESRESRCRFFVSDRPEGFTQVAERFLGRTIGGELETIELEALTGGC